VRQQRIHCLLQGAWFLNAVPISAPAPRRPARPWRFMRIDNSLKHLHYVDSPSKFSLLTPEGSLADAIAPDASRWADWTDGLNMLRRDSGHVASKETADFIQALTEIGLKIKLLDLSGDKVEIPSGLAAGPPPANSDFFFSDLYDPQ